MRGLVCQSDQPAFIEQSVSVVKCKLINSRSLKTKRIYNVTSKVECDSKLLTYNRLRRHRA